MIKKIVNKKFISKGLTFLTLFLGLNIAHAQERRIFPVSPSYTPADTSSISINRGGAGSDVIQVYLNLGKSYECSVIGSILADHLGVHYFSTFVLTTLGSVNAVATGMDYPAIAIADGVLAITNSQHARMRISIIPTVTGLHTIGFFEKTSDVNTADKDISCRETTLYGSYNRFFAQAAIVELRNASSADIPVSISIVDGGGNVVVNNQVETAKANTRSDIIFTNLPASSYGSIVITHAAPLGALSGYVAEYDSGSDGSIVLKRERALTVTAKADASTL